MNYSKLKDICITTQGVQISKDKQINKFKEGYIKYLYIADFKGENEEKFVENVYPEKIVTKNDLVMANTGSPGAVFKGIKGVLSNNLFKISFDRNILDRDFLYYYLASDKFQSNLQQRMKGGVQKHLGHKTIGEQDIPIIDINIQKKIVTILNKAQKLINKRKEQIDSLDKLVKSQFIEMFGELKSNPKGWEKLRIGDVFEIKTGATPSRKEKKYWDNGTIPWVKTTELKEVVINNAEEYITEEGFNKSSVNLLPKDTILIAMYGQGKTRGMTGKLGIEATTNQACAAILPNPKENMDFIWYQLRLSYEDLRDLARGGNQPNLNTNLIKSYELIFPSKELQQKFVDFIKQVDKLKLEMEKSLKELEDNFNSLIQRAFKGELFN